jgi:hypothetical protein
MTTISEEAEMINLVDAGLLGHNAVYTYRHIPTFLPVLRCSLPEINLQG